MSDARSATCGTTVTASGVGAIAGVHQASIARDEQAARRSDPRERRGWLRFLDPVLADEIRDAGALSCEELIVLAADPLLRRASRETLLEWWEYATRRGWLVAHEADRFRLTSTAHADLQARNERVSQPDIGGWAKALVKWALPAGVIGAAGYWTGRSGATALLFLGACLVLALSMSIAAWITGWMDRPADRHAARRACDWLDGRRVPWTLTWRCEARGPVTRLYGLSSLD